MISKAEMKIGKSILREEGIFSLIKRGFRYYLFPFLYAPFCYIKIKKIKIKDLNKLVDFVFNGCFEYIRPLQVKSEITSLLDFISTIKPRNVMEIGTANGGTLFLLCRTIPENAHIISLDLPGGSFGGGYPWFKIPLYKSFAQKGQIIKLVRGDSHSTGTLKRIKDILNNRELDLLFIDGDHTYEGIKKDFELYKHLVKKGGLIVFHDIVTHPPEMKCEVDKFWNQVKENYEHKEFVENWEQNRGGIGVIKI